MFHFAARHLTENVWSDKFISWFGIYVPPLVLTQNSFVVQERIKAALPTRRPFICPGGEDGPCDVEGKDWQALMRHYTGKHGILEGYLKEVIARGQVNKAYRENMKKPR